MINAFRGKYYFLSKNLMYTIPSLIICRRSFHLFDVLKDIGNNEYVTTYLRGKGYKVTKQE